MSKTKGDLAIEVFNLLAMNDGLTEPTPGEVSYVMQRMEQTVAQWEKKGIHLGYKYADPAYGPDTNDESGVFDTDESAVTTNLAVIVAPKFGRSASPDVKSQAKESYELLFTTELPTRQQNPNMPSGQGYSGLGGFSGSYMPIVEELTIPDDGNIDGITI